MKKPINYRVVWINPRSILRGRDFTDRVKAVLFFGRFPYGTAAILSDQKDEVIYID